MPGPRPTSADVARLAGVSRTTVSFVLNERDARISARTRRRVLEAAETLGYHPSAPARQLAAGASHTLGLVLRQSREHIAADALLPETLRGLASIARTDRYRIVVEAAPPGGDDTFASLIRTGVADGVVVSGPLAEEPELVALGPGELPVVVQGSLPGSAVPSVDIDNREAAREAVAYLLDHGHRRIACIVNADRAYTSAADRLAGYRAALEAAGVGYDDELVATGAFDAQSGRRAIEALVESGVRFSAIFVASDVVAFGVLGWLRERGIRVPADVSVVGFDDIPLAAHADPPLTTIRTPAFDLGVAAGRVLLDLLAGRSVSQRTHLPAELVVRASAAQAP